MSDATLYKKVGRRYVPIRFEWYESDTDHMAVKSFRLTYAYANGSKRYEYKVTPDTAGFVAASLVAKVAIEEAIRDKASMRPMGDTLYTKKQQEAIKRFKLEMGGMYPLWWTETSAYEIADAAIKAVTEFAP